MDRLLDTAKSGPSALRRPEIARIVAAAILAGDTGFQRYRLHAYVMMPNHVHMLATPSVPSRSWLGPLKGFTAHEANRILGSAGSRFWQDRELKPGTDGTLHSTQPCRPSRRYTASKCANIRRPYFASTEVCP